MFRRHYRDEGDKQDVIDIAKSLKALDADSIPVNFLHAIDGTPLEGVNELNPLYCIKVLALFRFINPSKEIRISGGREVNLRSLQPLASTPQTPFLSETT